MLAPPSDSETESWGKVPIPYLLLEGTTTTMADNSNTMHTLGIPGCCIQHMKLTSSRQPFPITNIGKCLTMFDLSMTFRESLGSVVNNVHLFSRQHYLKLDFIAEACTHIIGI